MTSAEKTYRLIRLTIGSGDSVAITPEEYASIVRAKRGVTAALALEEKFNLLLENYADYETELLDLALRDSIFAHHDWGSFQDAIYAVNRRVVNLLSATRLYSDHVDHELFDLYGRRGVVPAVYREKRKAEREGKLSCRVMELIRNYLQHRSFPIHELSLDTTSDRDDPSRFYVRHSVHPTVAVSELQKDPRLDSEVLQDLARQGPKVPLTPMIREYVASIAQVHLAVREAMGADLSSWDATLAGAIDRAKQAFGETIAIAAARIDECQDGEEEYDVEELFDEPIKRRLYLVRRTSKARFLERGYVSSKPKSRDA